MDLEIFKKNIENREINIRPYMILLSIFIIILLVIILFNNNLKKYYAINGKVVDNKILVLVNNDELKYIVENKELLIERNNHIFTYKIFKINNQNNSNYLYNEVFLETNPNEYLIENNIIKLKIITDKTTIFDYLIKSLKGE